MDLKFNLQNWLFLLIGKIPFKTIAFWFALFLNAFLFGLFLSQFLEENILSVKTDPVVYETKFFDPNKGRRSFTSFQDTQRNNIFSYTPIKNQPKKTAVPLKNYLPELQAIARDIKLKGTMLLGFSNFALIHNNRTRKNKVYQEGQNILNTKAVVQKIEKNNITLQLGTSSLPLAIEKRKIPDNIIVPVKVEETTKKKDATKNNNIQAASSEEDRHFFLNPKNNDNTNSKDISLKQKTQTAKPNNQQPKQTQKFTSTNLGKQQKKVLQELNKEIAKEKYINDFNFNDPNAIQSRAGNIEVKEDYFQGALQNLPIILNHAKATSYSENGQFLGYRITNIVKGGIFDKLGIQENDIITRVNRKAIKGLEQVMQFFSILKERKNIEIDLLRNKNTLTINYSLI